MISDSLMEIGEAAVHSLLPSAKEMTSEALMDTGDAAVHSLLPRTKEANANKRDAGTGDTIADARRKAKIEK